MVALAESKSGAIVARVTAAPEFEAEAELAAQHFGVTYSIDPHASGIAYEFHGAQK